MCYVPFPCWSLTVHFAVLLSAVLQRYRGWNAVAGAPLTTFSKVTFPHRHRQSATLSSPSSADTSPHAAVEYYALSWKWHARPTTHSLILDLSCAAPPFLLGSRLVGRTTWLFIRRCRSFFCIVIPQTINVSLSLAFGIVDYHRFSKRVQLLGMGNSRVRNRRLAMIRL